MSFQIVNNANDITLNEGWVNSTHFKSYGREVDALGRKVNADYQGHKYRIIAKQERYYSILERIERIFQGIGAVISTWGKALQSKSTIHLFTKSKETVRFGVLEDQDHFSATFTISSGIGRLQSASAKGGSSEIADAIPSSRSLTSASFRAAYSCDEIMKVDHFSTLPPELLLKIFNMLSRKDRPKLSQICKNFTQAIESYLNLNPISSGIGRLQSAPAKGRSSEIADAIPSSQSLTSASFCTADSFDEIMKVADNFSTLPPELLLKIFNMLSIKDRPKLSQICKNFTLAIEAYLNLNPFERLLYQNVKPKAFPQGDRLWNFFISKNFRNSIITSDSLVKLWVNDTPPVIDIKEKEKFIRNPLEYPIDYLEIGGRSGGKSSNFLAATHSYEGLNQIWDLEMQKILATKEKGNNESDNLALLYLSYARDYLLWIGFSNGQFGCYNLLDISEISGFCCISGGGVSWISGDLAISRLFTKCYNNTLKIWDIQNPKNVCIKEISGVRGQIIYNSQLKLLIGVNPDHSISIWKGEDGTEIRKFIFPDSSYHHTIEGLHFNAEKGLLFASIQETHNFRPAGAKIVVWDVHSKKLVTSFSTYHLEYCYSGLAVSHIDFDPESGLILTGGDDIIGLWNLHDGKLVKVLPFPDGEFKKLIWAKKDHKLFVLKDRTLYLLDYSNSPFKVVTQ